jgi:hypothetical protein
MTDSHKPDYAPVQLCRVVLWSVADVLLRC